MPPKMPLRSAKRDAAASLPQGSKRKLGDILAAVGDAAHAPSSGSSASAGSGASSTARSAPPASASASVRASPGGAQPVLNLTPVVGVGIMKPGVMPANLKEKYCDDCNVSWRWRKWGYTSGEGNLCWACKNLEHDLFADTPTVTHRSLLPLLGLFCGREFCLFYVNLDAALLTYMKGKQRYYVTIFSQILDIPDVPDEETLSRLGQCDLRSPTLMVTIKDYLKVFCTPVTQSLPRTGHHIHTATQRVFVEVPSSQVHMIAVSTASGFASLRSLRTMGGDTASMATGTDHSGMEGEEENLFSEQEEGGRPSPHGAAEEVEDRGAGTPRRAMKGNASTLGASRHAVHRVMKVLADFKALEKTNMRGALRAVSSLLTNLEDKQTKLSQLQRKGPVEMDMILKVRSGLMSMKLVDALLKCSEKFDADSDAQAFLHSLQKSLRGDDQKKIVLPVFLDVERMYQEALMDYEYGNYDSVFQTLHKKPMQHLADRTEDVSSLQRTCFCRLIMHVEAKEQEPDQEDFATSMTHWLSLLEDQGAQGGRQETLLAIADAEQKQQPSTPEDAAEQPGTQEGDEDKMSDLGDLLSDPEPEVETQGPGGAESAASEGLGEAIVPYNGRAAQAAQGEAAGEGGAEDGDLDAPTIFPLQEALYDTVKSDLLKFLRVLRKAPGSGDQVREALANFDNDTEGLMAMIGELPSVVAVRTAAQEWLAGQDQLNSFMGRLNEYKMALAEQRGKMSKLQELVSKPEIATIGAECVELETFMVNQPSYLKVVVETVRDLATIRAKLDGVAQQVVDKLHQETGQLALSVTVAMQTLWWSILSGLVNEDHLSWELLEKRAKAAAEALDKFWEWMDDLDQVADKAQGSKLKQALMHQKVHTWACKVVCQALVGRCIVFGVMQNDGQDMLTKYLGLKREVSADLHGLTDDVKQALSSWRFSGATTLLRTFDVTVHKNALYHSSSVFEDFVLGAMAMKSEQISELFEKLNKESLTTPDALDDGQMQLLQDIGVQEGIADLSPAMELARDLRLGTGVTFGLLNAMVAVHNSHIISSRVIRSSWAM